ncbi:MAG: bifunctional DNA primase/polymerase, partial [Planctomycetes bacterium]|nr:bifunctional DNA primase/polymerase [Planctomycetota bacterium]
MMTVALDYAARGLAVFPLRGKMPAILKDDGGHGHRDATTDPARIRSWWKNYLRANIGIATRASGLLVLDVDPRHGGDKRLAGLEAEYGRLPHTSEVRSGGQGRHIYFKAPDDDNLPRRSNALGAGLDLPNYVVAPPSIHPDTHRSYIWAELSHPDDMAIAEIPAWLLTLLTCKPRPQRTRPLEQPPVGWVWFTRPLLAAS